MGLKKRKKEREDDEGEEKRKRCARKQEVLRREGGAFQRAEPREGSRAEGVDLRARTTGQRDFTLSHPPAPQINGLQPL